MDLIQRNLVGGQTIQVHCKGPVCQTLTPGNERAEILQERLLESFPKEPKRPGFLEITEEILISKNSPHAPISGYLVEQVKATKVRCKSKPKRGAHSKKHEIASIKIHGVACGDIASQEQVNQQARAKKELNAELRERAGHSYRSDYIVPSDIRANEAARKAILALDNSPKEEEFKFHSLSLEQLRGPFTF